MFFTRVFIFAIFCFIGVLGRKPCDFEDEKCLTNGSRRIHVDLNTGKEGVVKTSDPLTQNLIDAELSTVHYKLFDAKLSGMKGCDVELVRISVKDSKYTYNLKCPHLVLDAGYEIKGEVGGMFVEGKGTCKVDLYGYRILFSGDFTKSVGKDGKAHMRLTTHNLELEATEKVVYDFKNLYNGDKEKSDKMHAYINENWLEVDKALRDPTMKPLMSDYIDNCNDYLDVYAIEDIFYSD